jgi:hypothetical protein
VATRIWIRLAEAIVPAILALAILFAWQADRHGRAQLASQLAAAQEIIAQASANQKDRDAQLTQTLTQLTAQKQSNLTTAQLLQALPQALHLPAPIQLQPTSAPTAGANLGAALSPPFSDAHAATENLRTTTPASASGSTKGNSPADKPIRNSVGTAASDNPLPKTPIPADSSKVILPAADLRPLYDFALDCQACRAKLTAAQADLADEKSKSAALTRERDAALRVAKGGSALRRIVRATKWFLLGAAAGAVAAKATR